MPLRLADLTDDLLREVATSLLRCERFNAPAMVGTGDDILQFSCMCRAFRAALRGPLLEEARFRRNGRIWPMATGELAATRQGELEHQSRDLLRLFDDAMRGGVFCTTHPDTCIDRFNGVAAPRGKATVLRRDCNMVYYCADGDRVYTIGTSPNDEDPTTVSVDLRGRDGTVLECICRVDNIILAKMPMCFPDMYTRCPGAPPLIFMGQSYSKEAIDGGAEFRETQDACTYRREGDTHTRVNTYRFVSTKACDFQYVFFNSRSEVCVVVRHDRGDHGFSNALRYGFHVQNMDTDVRSATYCDCPYDITSNADLLVVHHGSHISVIRGPDHRHRIVIPLAPVQLLGQDRPGDSDPPFTTVSPNGQFIVTSSWAGSYIIRLLSCTAGGTSDGYRITKIEGVIEMTDALDWIFTSCSRFCVFFDTLDQGEEHSPLANVYVADMNCVSLHDHAGTSWSTAAPLRTLPLRSSVTNMGNIPASHVPEVVQFSETSFMANGKNHSEEGIDRLVGVELHPALVRGAASRRGSAASAASAASSAHAETPP